MLIVELGLSSKLHLNSDCYVATHTIDICIQHDFYIETWLSDIQVGYELDVYLAHCHYPTLINPNHQMWLERRWERNGWISGHVEDYRT